MFSTSPLIIYLFFKSWKNKRKWITSKRNWLLEKAAGVIVLELRVSSLKSGKRWLLTSCFKRTPRWSECGCWRLSLFPLCHRLVQFQYLAAGVIVQSGISACCLQRDQTPNYFIVVKYWSLPWNEISSPGVSSEHPERIWALWLHVLAHLSRLGGWIH